MMENSSTLPTRDDVIEMVAEKMYSGHILNNAHRGDVVEMMVLSALGEDWKLVGLGWHPWDLQRGSGKERVRIQVRQSAALQLWGRTKKQILKFGWKKKIPYYFHNNNPGEEIESEGWFCDVFVFGIHLEDDKNQVDQVDPTQWKFLVIPTSELKSGRDSMVLAKALKRWQSVSWNQLAESVEVVIEQNKRN